MKYVTRNYRGYVIESFLCSQLGGEGEYKGRAYSIWESHESRNRGDDSLNMAERIDYLSEAKGYIDELIEFKKQAVEL